MKKIVKSLLLTCVVALAISNSYAQISVGIEISANIAPPALPVYVQPVCPNDGYLWQPGYWAYTPDGGYYWVPGVWVAPPNPGLLWTPCYWGFEGGVYGFHMGYWGPHVGFYGGINYGFGYGGVGFGGGRWEGGHFSYNTAVMNVNRTVIHNTYVDRTVINNTTVNRYSFNGPGGIDRKPNAAEESAMKEKHVEPTAEQRSHQEFASKNKAQFANVNHGRPAAAAMNKVGGNAYGPHGKTADLNRANAAAAKVPANTAATRARENAATKTRENAAAAKTRANAAATKTHANTNAARAQQTRQQRTPAARQRTPQAARQQPAQHKQPQRTQQSHPAPKQAPHEKRD